MAESQLKIVEQQITKEVTLAYYALAHWTEMTANYTYLDSIYKTFANGAEKRFKAGETNNLEWLLAQSKQKEVEQLMKQAENNQANAMIQLNKWIQTEEQYTISEIAPENMLIFPLDTANNPTLMSLNQNKVLLENQMQLSKKSLLPDIKLGAFQGRNNSLEPNKYYGVQAGIAVPLFFKADKSRISAAKTDMLIQENEYDNFTMHLNANYQTLIQELATYQQGISYYQDYGKQLYEETLKHANRSYYAGEIDYLQYVSLLEHANTIKINYLHNNFFYNITAIEAKYILN
jgi:cobalt-zinc-cadmium resistance protein CzcA